MGLTFDQFINELQSRNWPLKKSGKDYHSRCPVHLGSDTSLVISPGDVQEIVTKCHSQHCEHENVMKAFGLWEEKPKQKKNKNEIPDGVSLSTLASVKGFTPSFLQKMGCKDATWSEKDWKGKKIPAVFIDYGNGRFRARLGARGKDAKWGGDKQKPICVYKPQKIVGDTCFMVEGESDTWTLIHHGYNAIGVPGASMAGAIYPDDLKGVNNIYVMQETDDAGKSFVKNVSSRLGEIKWGGNLFVIDMAALKHKDVNEIHRRKKEQFKAILEIGIESAITPEYRYAEIGDEHIFRIYSDRIVYLEEKKSTKYEIVREPKTIINQGVVVESVHRDVFNGECTVTIRWGKNKRKKFHADILLFSKHHNELARHGILSDSNNSKYVVTYFNTVISKLIKQEKISSNRNGWNGDKFVYGKKMMSRDEADIPVEFEAIEYKPEKKGDKEEQIKAINKLIDDPQIALKAGAAAVSSLVEKIGCENFTYHSWGDSGRGKTTGSKIGASLYSKPTRILNSWEGTRAGIETIMEEAGGLPIFLEESHKGKPDSVIQTIYAFANKKQAARSEMKDGRRYRRKSPLMTGVIISTGEWQISSLSADGGATARLLEQHKTRIQEDGYAEKIEKSMADLEENYGHFGEEIIRYFLKNEKEVVSNFEKYKKQIRANAEGGIQYRQIPYFAACLVGCDIIRDLGLNVPKYRTLKECCIETMSFKPRSLYDKAMEYLIGCLDEYQNKFYVNKLIKKYGEYSYEMQYMHVKGDVFGYHDEETNMLYIYSKVFTDLVKSNNMSRNSVLQTLLENNALEVDKHKSKRLFTKKRRVMGALKQTIAIKIPQEYITDEDDTPDPQPPQQKKEPQQEQEVLAPYFAEGYDFERGKTDSKGYHHISYYYHDERIDGGFSLEKEITEKARSIFENHKRSLQEQSQSIEVWKKNNKKTVDEKVTEAPTGQYEMFGRRGQYDDERGM